MAATSLPGRARAWHQPGEEKTSVPNRQVTALAPLRYTFISVSSERSVVKRSRRRRFLPKVPQLHSLSYLLDFPPIEHACIAVLQKSRRSIFRMTKLTTPSQ